MNHFKDVCKIVTERAGAMNISLSDNTSLAITLVATVFCGHTSRNLSSLMGVSDLFLLKITITREFSL